MVLSVLWYSGRNPTPDHSGYILHGTRFTVYTLPCEAGRAKRMRMKRPVAAAAATATMAKGTNGREEGGKETLFRTRSCAPIRKTGLPLSLCLSSH